MYLIRASTGRSSRHSCCGKKRGMIVKQDKLRKGERNIKEKRRKGEKNAFFHSSLLEKDREGKYKEK